MLAAALVAALKALEVVVPPLRPLPAILPIDPDASQRLTALTVCIALLALGIGLARRKRAAWWLAISVLLPALVVQLSMLRHPISASLAGLSLLVLFLDRRRYRVSSGRASRRITTILSATGVAIAGAALALAAATGIGIVRPDSELGSLVNATVRWMALGDPTVALLGQGALLAIIVLIARVVVAAGFWRLLTPAESPDLDPGLQLHATAVAERFGHGALRPFQLGNDKSYFTLPDAESAIAFARDGRVAVALGDPIGPPEAGRRVAEAFLRECARRDWVPCVYQASSAGLPLLTDLGLRPYLIGKEATIDLTSFDLTGGKRANLRHTVTRAQRGGVAARWYPDGVGGEPASLIEQLRELDRAWRGNRPEMGFTISRFDPIDLVRYPVSVAYDDQGNPLAFATFRATGEGGCVLDLIRRQPGGVPGAMELCLASAATELRAAGFTTLSLGLAPLAGLESGRGVVERLLALGARAIRPAYDVRGLAFFKGKFAPTWEARYLVVGKRASLPRVLMALLRLHLGGAKGLLKAAGAEIAPHRRTVAAHAGD